MPSLEPERTLADLIIFHPTVSLAGVIGGVRILVLWDDVHSVREDCCTRREMDFKVDRLVVGVLIKVFFPSDGEVPRGGLLTTVLKSKLERVNLTEAFVEEVPKPTQVLIG